MTQPALIQSSPLFVRSVGSRVNEFDETLS
jgi:hypothetical protein